MFIVHLTSTTIPDDFLLLTEAIRSNMKAVGCQIDSEFRLHVTLGRIIEKDLSLKSSRFGFHSLVEAVYFDAIRC
jgi:2'-5' RNA ligase